MKKVSFELPSIQINEVNLVESSNRALESRGSIVFFSICTFTLNVGGFNFIAEQKTRIGSTIKDAQF